MAGSGAGVIQAELSVEFGQFLAALNAANSALAKYAQGAGAAMNAANQATTKADTATKGFTDTLSEFRTENVQQTRQAKYFANTLTEIIPASEGAKSALAGLISIGLEGAAGGFGFGLALEAATFLSGQIQRIVGEEEEAKKKAEEWGVSMRGELISMGDEADKLRRKLANVTPDQESRRKQADTTAALARMEKERAEIAERYNRAMAESGKLETSDWYKGYTQSMGKSGISDSERDRLRLKEIDEGNADTKTKSIGVLRAEAAALRDLAAEQERTRSAEAATESAKLAAQLRIAKATTATQKIEAEYSSEALDAGIEFRDGALTQEQLEQRINLAYEKRVVALREVLDLTMDLREAQLAGGMSGFEDAARLTLSPEEQKRLDADAERARLQDIEDRSDKSGSTGFEDARLTLSPEENARLAKDALESLNKEQRAAIDLGQQWGQTLGDAIGGLIDGTMTLGQVFAKVGQQIVAQLVQIAIQSVTASAVKAGGEAAASQAGIPIVGPVLAISAMGAMMAAVLGLLGNIGARALGGPVVPSGTYLVGERGPEVLRVGAPGYVTPNGKVPSGGALAGITFNFNGPADQAWWRSQERYIVRTLREASRAGRA